MIHIVSAGDTLYSIANAYGLPLPLLLGLNGLTEDSVPVVGQTLLILIPTDSYTILPDETLFEISEKTGVDENRILQYNPWIRPPLRTGEILYLSYEGIGTDDFSLYGYAYPFASETLLNTVFPYLRAVSVFTYGFRPDGSLVIPPRGSIPEVARRYRTSLIMELATLTENGNFDSSLTTVLFADESVRDRLIENILNELADGGYGGIELDFEYIKPEETTRYIDFANRLADILHQNGYQLSIALAPKTRDDQPGLLYEAHDYAALSLPADGVFLMTYEWGYKYGPPMAIAPIDRVRAVLDYAVTRIPANKIFLGLANYGYNWTLPFDKSRPAETISQTEALDLARRYGAEIRFDSRAASPYFDYTDERGEAHQVWFEDLRSIREKLDLAKEYGIRGAGIWTVIRPFPSLYPLCAAAFSLR